MNKTLKYMAAIALAVAGLSFQAQASVIDLGIRVLAGPLGNASNEAAFIESDQSLASGSLTYLNKFDNGGSFDNGGAVDSSHFDVTLTSGGANALISWDLSGTGFQLNYVLVKDGRGTSGGQTGQLYHLYGVTADQAFNSVSDQLVTVNGSKGISHIAFFGTEGNNNVPDGGSTVMLLGLGLSGLGMARRFIKR